MRVHRRRIDERRRLIDADGGRGKQRVACDLLVWLQRQLNSRSIKHLLNSRADAG